MGLLGKGPRLVDSLAVVLPRYGESLGGGAETLVRALIKHMNLDSSIDTGYPRVKKLEVWTTCAVDHRTWENVHPPGATDEDGIIIRRFPVSDRDLEIFIQFEMALQHGLPVSLDQQLDWLSNSVNSYELYQHIAAHNHQFDAILFAPYLFATSFWGALIAPERSVLIPCLHNESYAYLSVFQYLFGKVRGLLFNAKAEMELAHALYDVPDFEDKSFVVGMGFDVPENGSCWVHKDAAAEVQEGQAPFLLYSGRKEKGKNLDLLLDCFSLYRSQYPDSDLELRIMGSGEIDFLDELPGGVVDLGFVSEEEKKRLMGDALALVQPSVNESFSIVIMEAWMAKTPVVVHGKCAVTKDHVVDSGGGLYFGSAEEFVELANVLLEDSSLRERMGEAGYHYVETEYSWKAVTDRLLDAFTKLNLSPCKEQGVG